MSLPSLTDRVLNNKWRLGALVGAGACADVYEATDVSSEATAEPGRFVAKIAQLPGDLSTRSGRELAAEERNADMLHYEKDLYWGHLCRLRDLEYVVEVRVHDLGVTWLMDCAVVYCPSCATFKDVRALARDCKVSST